MYRHFTHIFCNVALASAVSVASAEEVTLKHGDLTLLADFVQAEDAGETVALITHGTLAHKDMELVETLQDSLAEQGVSSLAHTLSLGIDQRRGMYDCTIPHTHRDEDADTEIAAWIDWLRDQGTDSIALVGHSRGGKQVARTASTRDDIAAAILIAPATVASARRANASIPDLQNLVIRAMISAVAGPRDFDRFLYCDDAKVSLPTVMSYYGSALEGTKLMRGAPTGAETYAPDIAAPILVIAGSKDTVVPEVPATFMPLRSDTLRFELVEDADHMFLDFYAEDAATLIAEFLADLPAPDTVDDFEATNAPLYAAADLAYGEYLASECLACHKPGGADGVPPVAGLEAWYTHLALIQYANAERDNAAMRLVAKSLDDEQRIAVAAYFASLEAE